MTRRMILLLGALTLVVAACGGDDVHPDVTAARNPDSVATGAELYAENCAACHGASLEGASGPNLAESELGHPDADFVDAIANGKGEMPALGGTLSGDEIQSIVDFIRTVQAAGVDG